MELLLKLLSGLGPELPLLQQLMAQVGHTGRGAGRGMHTRMCTRTHANSCPPPPKRFQVLGLFLSHRGELEALSPPYSAITLFTAPPSLALTQAGWL